MGGRKIFGIGVAVTALLTLVTPWCARINVYFLLVLRIVEGIFEVSLNTICVLEKKLEQSK